MSTPPPARKPIQQQTVHKDTVSEPEPEKKCKINVTDKDKIPETAFVADTRQKSSDYPSFNGGKLPNVKSQSNEKPIIKKLTAAEHNTLASCIKGFDGIILIADQFNLELSEYSNVIKQKVSKEDKSGGFFNLVAEKMQTEKCFISNKWLMLAILKKLESLPKTHVNTSSINAAIKNLRNVEANSSEA